MSYTLFRRLSFEVRFSHGLPIHNNLSVIACISTSDVLTFFTDLCVISSGENASIAVGNSLPLKSIPTGTQVHNIELSVGRGGQIVRSAGGSAQVLAKEDKYTLIRLPSGEIRQI